MSGLLESSQLGTQAQPGSTRLGLFKEADPIPVGHRPRRGSRDERPAASISGLLPGINGASRDSHAFRSGTTSAGGFPSRAALIVAAPHRATGQAVLRYRDEKGMVAVRLRPGQFRMLATAC